MVHRHSPYCRRQTSPARRFRFGFGESGMELRAHINVDRTNGGGAVAYLMKYAFKTLKLDLVQVEMQREEDAHG